MTGNIQQGYADAILGYADAAVDLIPKYESVSSSEMYAPFADLLSEKTGRMIDIGAGTGRDAAWFADKGFEALAVEPVAEFREAGAASHPSPRIKWMDDALPSLEHVLKRGNTFDLLVLNAVWHHLTATQRQRAWPKLQTLAAREALLIMSIRHGPGVPSRPCFDVSAQKTMDLATAHGFKLEHLEERHSVQAHNRAAGVFWTWLALSKD